MQILLKIIPLALYFIVGLISLSMAHKSLLSKTFISFHEAAARTPISNLDERLQHVILSIMRTTGLGFLVVGLLLIIFPLINYFKPNAAIGLGIPMICGIYCFGLYLVNYRLHKNSRVETPWKGSLVAAAILAVEIIITIL